MSGGNGVSERILAGLSAGIVAVSRDGIVLEANDAARNHLGLRSEELRAGTVFSSLPGMQPLAAMIAEAIGTRKTTTRGEVSLGRATPSRKEIGVSVSPLLNGADVEGAILLFSDMTERRRQERTAALNRQLADLGGLAAGVVHQVRNPLTIITGRAELLLRQAEGGTQRDYLTSIIHESNQIAESITTFLQCAKPFEFKPRECEARAIADRSVQLCAKLMNDTGTEIVIDAPSELTPLHIDPERTAEALARLVENAIEASPRGGAVNVSAAQDGLMTVFRVVDSGNGVHADSHDDIYSPFFTQKRDGSGLGLSIAQRIVTLQGGTMRHYNIEGSGACFEMEVPTQPGS